MPVIHHMVQLVVNVGARAVQKATAILYPSGCALIHIHMHFENK
jgi:hypothetical protein